jgi:superfamily II DNA or RNA helicase
VFVLSFDQGTLLLEGPEAARWALQHGFLCDDRSGQWRAEAIRYREIVLALRKQKVPFEDRARKYRPLQFSRQHNQQLFDYQEQAVAAWRQADQRGIVVLPTGAGKTLVAIEALRVAARPALIVVPTLNLMNQWHSRLHDAFGGEIGLIGQGVFDLRELTVITYHSAYRRMAEIGNQFGMLVFDEVHHLPATEWAEIARLAIAPFRLGMTATYDPRLSATMEHLVGPLVYWKQVREMSGSHLAPYDVIRISVPLSVEEQLAYDRDAAIYRTYWQDCKAIRLNRFAYLVKEQARDPAARRALEAWRGMRMLAGGAEAKLDLLEDLFQRHASERIIIFTATNETAYRISEAFLIPAITHQTKARERKTVLARLESGQYKAVVTSKVLNEGVDVPSASIAVILGGSASSREHMQRLGRILRKAENKQALLYEVTARGTMEASISYRRRQSEAYAGKAKTLFKSEIDD